MSAEKANGPDAVWLWHWGLQRVAVIGLGRTATAKVAPVDAVAVNGDGAVVLLVQAMDTVRMPAVRPAKSGFTLSSERRQRRRATSASQGKYAILGAKRVCEADASDHSARVVFDERRNRMHIVGVDNIFDMPLTFA
jgi:hypothetical protein